MLSLDHKSQVINEFSHTFLFGQPREQLKIIVG